MKTAYFLCIELLRKDLLHDSRLLRNYDQDMNKSKSSRIVKSLLALFIFSLFLVFGLIWYTSRTPSFGGDFTLQFKEESWTLSEHKKPLSLLYFGYVKCPDVCPMTLSVARQAFLELNEKQKSRLQLIFVSVDRDHETADDVATYAAQFHPQFIGLSGSREQIDHAVKLFKASYMLEEDPKSYLGYSVAHTDKIYLLNSKGMVIDMIQSPRNTHEVLEPIERHL